MRTLSYFNLLVLLPLWTSAQGITANQQKALNGYVDYANQSADEISSVVKSIMEYYPKIHQKNRQTPRYVCPIQPEEYYYTNTLTLSKALSTHATTLNARLKDLRGSADQIDKQCKALDTYHKLEDYKQDNFSKAESLISEFPSLLKDYKQKQLLLQKEVEKVFKQLSPGTGTYSKADAQLRAAVEHERLFIDSWTLNLKEEIHTGWPVDKLVSNIPETDALLSALKKSTPALKYPASSMWTSFQGNLGSVLESKRNALDGYNNEAKKSDAYSNDVYLSLINYFNGTLVADYNTFIGFSERDGYLGLKTFKYFIVADIRIAAKSVEVKVEPFHDISRVPVTMPRQTSTVTKPVFDALANYVDYINETWRQTRYLQSVLVSFNSTAAYYKSLETFERRGAMHFDYKDFALPLSSLQKTVADSKSLPPAVAKTLNDQAQVLMNVLKEMNALCAALEIEVSEKRYEKDHLTKVYEILERQSVLLNVWDDKKERLYEDVRTVFDSYPPASPGNSWYKSGAALRSLTDLDHDALFKVKPYYKDGVSVTVSTEKIDETLRDVIAKEYDNMKGIQKLGRYNGLCPYTPYEDLPEKSKLLSEEIKKLKPPSASRYDHPYYKMVYHYNNIVDDYNKFSELSKEVLLLKTVKQPELFSVKYPSEKIAKEPALPESKPAIAAVTVGEANTLNTKPVESKPTAVQQKVVHDTIYIEKRDTVYLHEPAENLRSMEGYAINNMVLLLDVSGSMNAPEKLPLLKSSILDLLSMMRPEDEIAMVVFSEKPKVVLQPVSFKEEEKIKAAIAKLKSSGKTDANAALRLAYKVADENYLRGGNNRIILATDGEFAISEETRLQIEKFGGEDIFLSVFNFGKGMGSSKALENLALLGKGNYQAVSKENVELNLIREAKAKRKK